MTKVIDIGEVLQHKGNTIGKFGHDIEADEMVFVWYHKGAFSPRKYAMDVSVFEKVPSKVDRFFVANNDGVFMYTRSQLEEGDKIEPEDLQVEREETQLAVRADEYEEAWTEHSEVLSSELWKE